MLIKAGIARIEGDLILASATRLLAEGESALRDGATAFDLSGASQMDSSALSLILSLRRRASAAGKTIEFHNIPANLVSLAKLYGVAELLSDRL